MTSIKQQALPMRRHRPFRWGFSEEQFPLRYAAPPRGRSKAPFVKVSHSKEMVVNETGP